MSKYLVSVQKFIPVPAQKLFDIVADPQQHPRFDASGSVVRADIAAPEKLELGSTFGVRMLVGAQFQKANTVVEYEEGERIAWRSRGGYLCRYSFEPTEGGTVVTEEWDARTSKRRFGVSMAGFPQRSFRSMTATLDRLHDVAVEGLVGA